MYVIINVNKSILKGFPIHQYGCILGTNHRDFSYSGNPKVVLNKGL